MSTPGPCTETVRIVPGPVGNTGAAGADGTDGINAFTLTTAAFVMPAVAATVIVPVEESSFLSPLGGAISGQIVHVQFAGYFAVTSLPTALSATLQNLGYTGNAAPGAVIPISSKVSPAGLQGPAGTNGTTPTFDDITPTLAKGDLIVDNGAGATRIAVGANGTRLVADSTQATGHRYDKVSLDAPSEVDGTLPVANGGTGAVNAAAAAIALSVLPLTGGTVTGDLRVSKVLAKLWLDDTAAPADERKFYLLSSGGTFQLVLANDAEAVFNAAFTVNRTGATIDSFVFNTLLSAAQNAEFLKQNRYAMAINTALIAGANHDVALGDVTFVKIKAGPGAPFSITGLTGGASGRRLILYNATGQAMTLNHENVGSVASARILTMDAADFVTTANGLCELLYDDDASRWIVTTRET